MGKRKKRDRKKGLLAGAAVALAAMFARTRRTNRRTN